MIRKYHNHKPQTTMSITPSVLVAPVSVMVDTMIATASATTVLGLVHYVSNSYSNSSDSNFQSVGGTCQCNSGYYDSDGVSDNIAGTCTLRK